MTTTKITVTGCLDCPFENGDHCLCSHPKFGGLDADGMWEPRHEGRPTPMYGFPSWGCPLLDGHTTVVVTPKVAP